LPRTTNAKLHTVVCSKEFGVGHDYPPMGLSENVRKLPKWIQAGCGPVEYYSEEKKATFQSENMPEKLNLSKHNSYFADVMKANPVKLLTLIRNFTFVI
jgi:hypothetical protein